VLLGCRCGWSAAAKEFEITAVYEGDGFADETVGFAPGMGVLPLN
jgi:hypothetical protein